MENATKALLIAASVLIAIVLIAMGIKLLQPAAGTVDEVGKVTDTIAITSFNSQFTDYEGTQTGAEVKALLNKITATNRNESTHKISVNGSSSSTDIATYRAGININTTYTVEVSDSDGDGYVDTISIK